MEHLHQWLEDLVVQQEDQAVQQKAEAGVVPELFDFNPNFLFDTFKGHHAVVPGEPVPHHLVIPDHHLVMQEHPFHQQLECRLLLGKHKYVLGVTPFF